MQDIMEASPFKKIIDDDHFPCECYCDPCFCPTPSQKEKAAKIAASEFPIIDR